MLYYTFLRNIFLTAFFAVLVVILQTSSYRLLLVWGAIWLISYWVSDKTVQLFLATIAIFGLGFFVYLYAISSPVIDLPVEELSVFLNRLSLLAILLPLLIFTFNLKSSRITCFRKPQWNKSISFPFIWSGFHKTSVRSFLVIALAVNTAVFMPAIVSNGWSTVQQLWLLALSFSVTNAILEEAIWRGVLLNRFTEALGEKMAVMATGLGFGLQHYSLGFPWTLCLLFSVGGLFYGGITVKSESILPVIGWHMALNFLMVFSGLLFEGR